MQFHGVNKVKIQKASVNEAAMITKAAKDNKSGFIFFYLWLK